MTLGWVSGDFISTKEEQILFNEYIAAHLLDDFNVNLINITLSAGLKSVKSVITKPWVDISWTLVIPNFPIIDKSFRIKCAALYLVPNPRQGKPRSYCKLLLSILSPPELNGSFVIPLRPIQELICENIPRYLMLNLLLLLVMTHSSIIYMSHITDRAVTNQSRSMFLCLLYLTHVIHIDYMQLHIEICII